MVRFVALVITAVLIGSAAPALAGHGGGELLRQPAGTERSR